MSDPRAQSSMADIRRRTSGRLELLPFLKESPRPFSLGEVPAGIVHGAYFVTIPQGLALGTWKVNAANGFDWQSSVEVTVACKFSPHRSVKDHDAALVWAHKIVVHLVGVSDSWPIDLRIKGSDVTVSVEPDSSGNFEIIKVGLLVRHNLSITEAA